MSDREPSLESSLRGMIMIIVGGLLTLFFGGCALLFPVMMIVVGLEDGYGLDAFMVLGPIVLPVVGGLAIAWGGIVLMRRGIRLWKG